MSETSEFWTGCFFFVEYSSLTVITFLLSLNWFYFIIVIVKYSFMLSSLRHLDALAGFLTSYIILWCGFRFGLWTVACILKSDFFLLQNAEEIFIVLVYHILYIYQYYVHSIMHGCLLKSWHMFNHWAWDSLFSGSRKKGKDTFFYKCYLVLCKLFFHNQIISFLLNSNWSLKFNFSYS